ncbi:MAG: hypothetical protein JW709_07530 [Sedimentisphaerales bacterium]|nr:hypothetical protein [Sedimentisphaerales bacterium]
MDCPYIDADNPLCSRYLNLGCLNDAFELCTRHYMLCPIYLHLIDSTATNHQVVTVGGAPNEAQFLSP